MSIEEKNKDLMKTLDDAWNSQDWDTFEDRHAENVAVFWPGQQNPTRGVRNHRKSLSSSSRHFLITTSLIIRTKYFLPTVTIPAQWPILRGTFKGPMKGLDGKKIQPTNKKFQEEFCDRCDMEKWKDYQRRGYSMIW